MIYNQLAVRSQTRTFKPTNAMLEFIERKVDDVIAKCQQVLGQRPHSKYVDSNKYEVLGRYPTVTPL